MAIASSNHNNSDAMANQDIHIIPRSELHTMLKYFVQKYLKGESFDSLFASDNNDDGEYISTKNKKYAAASSIDSMPYQQQRVIRSIVQAASFPLFAQLCNSPSSHIAVVTFLLFSFGDDGTAACSK